MINRTFQTKAKVIKNIEVIENYYKIVVLSPAIAKAAQPGQFLQVKVGDNYKPLLRRPFGIHRVNGPNVEMLFEVVGQGTEALAQRRPGEYMDIIGPLGKGFYAGDGGPGHSAILVAGGMGIAPLAFLVERLRRNRQGKSCIRKSLVLIGARTKKQLLCESELKKLGCKVRVSTDDGSKGFKGKVTGLLAGVLRSTRHAPGSRIYACGPRPMLKEVARMAREYNLPAEVSLEEHMACGIGACLGCVVKTKDGYKRVCKEGPVFDSREIVWG